MTRLQDKRAAARAAYDKALREGDFLHAVRLAQIIKAIDRELDGTAHHPNCECNRCFSNMGDDA